MNLIAFYAYGVNFERTHPVNRFFKNLETDVESVISEG